MASDFNGDFARLVPRNSLAQVLFSKTWLFVEKNDTFHLQFMTRTGDEPSRASSEPVEESTEYETYPDTDGEDSQLKGMQNSGHFIFSFNEKRAPEMPHLGWRIGRGTSKSISNRNVDLLLAKPRGILSKSLASIHMLIRFNLRSGFLILKGGSPKAPVEIKIGTTWKVLEHGREHLLHQPFAIVRAGDCEYELEYTVEEKHRGAYFKQRDAFLKLLSPIKGEPQLEIQKIPGDSYVLRGRYLEFGTRGSGTFGWITQGVDTGTGDPVAIKELRISSRRSRLDVMAEVNVGKRFLVS